MQINRKGNWTSSRVGLSCSILLLGLSISSAWSAETGGRAQQGTPVTCSSGFLPTGAANNPPDLLVTGECHVKPDETYYFENINVLGKGRLVFDELDKKIKSTATHFWAQSIVVENGGTITAGSSRQPYGIYG